MKIVRTRETGASEKLDSDRGERPRRSFPGTPGMATGASVQRYRKYGWCEQLGTSKLAC